MSRYFGMRVVKALGELGFKPSEIGLDDSIGGERQATVHVANGVVNYQLRVTENASTIGLEALVAVVTGDRTRMYGLVHDLNAGAESKVTLERSVPEIATVADPVRGHVAIQNSIAIRQTANVTAQVIAQAVSTSPVLDSSGSDNLFVSRRIRKEGLRTSAIADEILGMDSEVGAVVRTVQNHASTVSWPSPMVSSGRLTVAIPFETNAKAITRVPEVTAILHRRT
jgi:hypothetical protein